MSVTGCLGVFLFLYWLLCRSLRFRRRDHIANTFKGRDLYSLTIDEAQWILLQIVHSELPAMSRLGTSFALFRTYGICTIADILARTKQTATRDAGKRLVDTGVLITEFIVQPFDGERHAKALGRVNWLHGQYNISNDDLLYTLSVFISAPERWLIKYDWRCLTELELTAWWIVWREVGLQMNIKHIPERWSDLRDWADNYEQKTMYPTKNSHQLAETTLAIVLGNTPSLLRGFKKRVFISLMDNRLRIAMKYPPQSKYIHLFTRGFFEFRKILLRNFFLPRRKPLSNTPKNKNKYGRYNRIFAEQTEPWYIAEDSVGLIERFINKLRGLPNPSDDFYMRGYLSEELGPKAFEGKGKKDIDRETERLIERGKWIKENGTDGCPFTPLN